MRINRLEIENFRAISQLSLSNLSDVVVVAGPNGCGKSTIFDAIRLLKSVYGGYQQNEWQQWFSEFQINVGQSGSDFLAMFQDRSKPLRILAEIDLAPEEIEWLKQNASELTRNSIWKQVAPETAGWRYVGSSSFAVNLRAHEPEVKKRAETEVPLLLKELERTNFVAEFNVELGPTPLLSRRVSLNMYLANITRSM